MIRRITVEIYRRWLAARAAPVNGLSAEEWLEEWGRLGDAKLRDARPGPTATEILAADRNRLESS